MGCARSGAFGRHHTRFLLEDARLLRDRLAKFPLGPRVDLRQSTTALQ
jgi:hypothetical protein